MTARASFAEGPHFCILPWVHLYVSPSSDVHPCCYGAMDRPVGNLLENDLVDIMNGEGMKSLRRQMLAGEPSRHCERCYKAEAAGFRTMRQNCNDTFRRYVDDCGRTRADGHLDEFAFRYLDVRFSNICNLKCRFCWHDCSSAWYDDQKALDPGYGKPRILRAGRSDRHLWEQIVDSLASVDDIYFAGGEPLLMPEHYDILDHLDQTGRHDVRLSYTTNLSVLAYKDRKVVDHWKRFESVAVGFSLDGIGRRGEYIRKGLDWAAFEANLEKVRDAAPNVRLRANLTINVLNVFDLLSIYGHFERDPLFHGIPLGINFLDQPESMCIQVLPASIKAALSADLLDYAASCLGEARREDRDNLGAIVAFMNDDDKSHLLPELFARSDRLDRIRGEAIDEIMPEFGQLRAYAEAAA